MKRFLFLGMIVSFLSLLSFPALAAGCVHSLGLGAGIVVRDSNNETDFSVAADYECRLAALYGVGAIVNHIFSDPSTTVIGAPQLLLHPFGGELFVAGSPIVEFGRGSTDFGVRFSTRVPLPLGLLTLVPSAAIDFIRGGRRYWLGLGLRF
jgi:hypothetical protein